MFGHAQIQMFVWRYASGLLWATQELKMSNLVFYILPFVHEVIVSMYVCEWVKKEHSRSCSRLKRGLNIFQQNYTLIHLANMTQDWMAKNVHNYVPLTMWFPIYPWFECSGLLSGALSREKLTSSPKIQTLHWKWLSQT